MESENETQFNEVFVPEIKVEYDSDSSDSKKEKKWNADPLAEGTVVNVCMPIIKDEDVKFETTECSDEQLTTKPEEKYYTSSNEDVSSLSSDVTSPSCSISNSIINRTLQNSTNEHFYQPQYLCSNYEDITSQNSKDSQLERPYICSICNKSFTRREHLTVHHRIHTNYRPYTCSICNKSFTVSGNLRLHLRTHTNERPYTCNICNKSFKVSGNLSVHQRTHTNERPFLCNICNKSFTGKGDLIKHQRTHTNERPYTCNICNKSFTGRGDLIRHVRIHTNERPYKCDICNKSFTVSGTLKLHQRVHSNERPFSCNICNKSFKLGRHLSAHQRTHTNVQS